MQRLKMLDASEGGACLTGPESPLLILVQETALGLYMRHSYRGGISITKMTQTLHREAEALHHDITPRMTARSS